MLTAAKLAQATDMQVAIIRHYERLGLMPEPQRSDANYRLYPDTVIPRLRFIKRARELCFSLVQIKAMLDLSDAYAADGRCSINAVKDHLGEIDRRIASLHSLRRELETISDGSAHNASYQDVRIIPALK